MMTQFIVAYYVSLGLMDQTLLKRKQISPIKFPELKINGLVQERRNSIGNALELHLSCTKMMA